MIWMYLVAMFVLFVVTNKFAVRYGRLTSEVIPPRRRARFSLIVAVISYWLTVGAGVLALVSMPFGTRWSIGWAFIVFWFVWGAFRLSFPGFQRQAAELEREETERMAIEATRFFP